MKSTFSLKSSSLLSLLEFDIWESTCVIASPDIVLGLSLLIGLSLRKERSRVPVMFLVELLNGRRDLRLVDFMPMLFLNGESTGESAVKVDRLLDARSLRCLHD